MQVLCDHGVGVPLGNAGDNFADIYSAQFIHEIQCGNGCNTDDITVFLIIMYLSHPCHHHYESLVHSYYANMSQFHV